METTPVTSRHRSRISRKALKSREESPCDLNTTSTPKSEYSSRKNSFIGLSSKNDELDDTDDMFPPTQAFQHIIPKGEVFWDFEASPQTRAALNKRLDESSPDLPKAVKSPIRPLSPSLKIRPRKKRPTGSTELDSESKKLVDDMKQFTDQLIHSDSTTLPSTQSLKEDVFDSDEDSFLLLASQAVETEAKQNLQDLKSKVAKEPIRVKTPAQINSSFKKFKSEDNLTLTNVKSRPQVKTEPTEVKAEKFDVFDDDFNLFLSQLKSPESSPKVMTLKDLKSTVTEPQAKKPSDNSSFKKFKSEDNITLNTSVKSRPRNASGNIMKGWQEPPIAKCTKEQIALKKQAALLKRQQRCQSMKK